MHLDFGAEFVECQINSLIGKRIRDGQCGPHLGNGIVCLLQVGKDILDGLTVLLGTDNVVTDAITDCSQAFAFLFECLVGLLDEFFVVASRSPLVRVSGLQLGERG